MILKFRVYEQTISLQATKAEPRQGSKDYLELQFSFSSDWSDLLKYVYLQHGEVSVPHDLTEGSIIVDEYFTEQTEFNVTLFGRSADGSVEVPTNVVTVFLKESNNLWEKDAPAPQNSWVVQVIDARDEALAAAIRAENAAIHQPYPNSETRTWWVWNANKGEYVDTGVSAAGEKGDEGDPGKAPIIGSNGNWYEWDDASGAYTDTGKPSRGEKGNTGAEGADGADGRDGITPTIGDNGNWYLGGEDTGKPSRGEKGDPGADGKSAYAYAAEGGYTGTETAFAEKLAQEQLTGTTNDLTPTQVYNAVSAGIPVKVQYTDSTYGLLSFTAFNAAESLNAIVSEIVAYGYSVYMLCELVGYKTNNTWVLNIATLAQKTDIPSALPNPNALNFTGAVTGSYDGSNAKTVNIPSAVTDDHINNLIDTKLGVIENGAY